MRTAFPVIVCMIAAALALRTHAETVELERDHGIYMVPVQINGRLTIPFILDSGASAVAIPADVFLTLSRTKTVTDADFIGPGTYVMADGSEHQSQRFMLHEVKVGEIAISNVVANVVSVKGDPLLGQSFLSQLPTWSIDNQRHVLVLNNSGPVSPTAPSRDFGFDQPQHETPQFNNSILCGQPVSYQIDSVRTPDQYRGYLGVWTGVWNNNARICGSLVVQRIGTDGTADIVYVYGPSSPARPFPWKKQRAVGAILPDGRLSFQDEQGSRFTFSIEAPGILGGLFWGGKGRLSSSFRRYE
ncbi:MAG: retroviral-like aspartic protease family protein [Alphaproteobacteria bacterium]|nr:retroviral-like aspartic protease family protein [Alphaproteobacteria bacterium]